MELFKCVVCWLVIILLAPFFIVLVLALGLVLYIGSNVWYWATRPYQKFLDLIEELFSGGRGEYD